MRKTSIPATGEAMPERKPTEAQVADAMRELESPIIDLLHMARITCDIADGFFTDQAETRGEYLVFELHQEERDRFFFALFNVENRLVELKAQFCAAWNGEKKQ